MFGNDIKANLNLACREERSIDESLTFLEKAFDNTDVKISFWGNRCIYSSTNSGKVSLNFATSKTTEVFNKIRTTWNYSNEMRERLKTLEDKIDSFYKKSDKMKENKNLITQFFLWLREFSFIPYTTRFFWEENAGLSNYYTKEQWKQTFSERIPSEYSIGSSAHPDLYYHA